MAKQTVVEIKAFTKRFGTKTVHRDVNLKLYEGECLGLIGGSGSGKSVILRSIIGLEKPSTGSVVVYGRNITHDTENDLIDLRKRVAYVFQGGALFDSMTVGQNLAYPLIEHTKLSAAQIKERIHTTLDRFGLGGSEGLRPAALSGGMQKRVGLARAIIMEPSLILYDEPTAGLDPYNTKRIQEIILDLKRQGTTSILVTHDMPTAFAVCDRMVLLLDGHIVTEITREQFNVAGNEDNPIQRFIQGEEA